MTQSGRVVAVDLARGLALAGMMLAHLGPVQVGDTPPIGELVTSGRAAPLFAVLAGVSMTLVQRRDPSGAGSGRATVVRGALLVLLGLSLGSLRDGPVLIILAVYGVLVLVALPLRRLSTRVLLAGTVAWAVLSPIALLALRIVHEPVLVEQPSWSDVTDPWRLVTTIVVWGGYPAMVWLTYVLAGLLIGRLDLARAADAAALAVGGALATVGALAVGRLHAPDWRALFARDSYPYESVGWDELWVTGPHSSMPLNVIGASGSAALVVGLCAVLARSSVVRRVAAPVCAAGAMTLSLYTIHVLWTWRLRLDVTAPVEGGWDDWALQVLVLFAAAALYRRYVRRRGPLEDVVRCSSVTIWTGRRTTPVLD